VQRKAADEDLGSQVPATFAVVRWSSPDREGEALNRSALRRGSRLIPIFATLALVGTLLAVLAPRAGAATKPSVTISTPTADGTNATIKFTVNRQEKSIASRTCTLDSTIVGTPGQCGTKFSSTKSSVTYQVTLSGLSEGSHTFVVSITLTDGGSASGSTTFTVVLPKCATDISPGGSSSNNLQDVINAATTGDTIEIRGTCTGNFAIGKDLTFVGISGTSPTLDGNKTGHVLAVFSSTSVTLTDLTITNGTAEFGGGIINSGTVTLNGSSSVSGNTGTQGGGIWNNGSITLNGSSSVSGNSAFQFGGGILNEFSGSTLSLNDSSSVHGNTAVFNGGGIYSTGTLTMNDTSSVSGNRADADGDGFGSGGGIFNCTGTLSGAVDGGNVHDNYRGTGTTIDNISSCT
jgi:predicted outer membrane repeat protein